jgi:hypothetical protein
MLSKTWNKIKDWSGWDKAGTIVKARLETLAGLISAAFAGLLAFDWMPFFTNGDIDWKKVAVISTYLVASGVITEVVRRRGANL